MATETELRDWRGGHTLAERLCSGIMAIEGFADIDPQAPLGGPDGRKDILARRDGLTWLAAVYFPPTGQSSADVEAKFKSDVEGVRINGADAFAFFVNQRVTPGERSNLAELSPVHTEIYHLERLRAILDSPLGYGLRLEYLRITMSAEEQASWVLAAQQGMNAQLAAAQAALVKGQEREEAVLERTVFAGTIGSVPSSMTRARTEIQFGEAPLGGLTVEMLLFVHRLVAPDSLIPDTLASGFRPISVAVGDLANPSFVPPPPDEVPRRVAEYLEWWRLLYPTLSGLEIDAVVRGLAELHHRFVSIHPFLDGNGRVARALLDQAARELLARPIGPQLAGDPAAYFAALRAADAGDLDELCELIRQSLL